MSEPETQNEPPVAPEKPNEISTKISKDFDKRFEESVPPKAPDADPVTYDRDGDPGAWRTLEQRREIVLYRKKTGRWPEEVSKETGLQSYYEIRYFSSLEEHKRKYARQHALARQWWSEYKQAAQESTKDTAEMDTVKPVDNVLPYRRREGGSR